MRDPSGTPRRTWAFVMTLCFSRHQYVEFVWDQTVATWLGCHRRAFEWFGAVPARLIIDNAKCAISKACRTDPIVQRAYAECAVGYGFKIEACPPADPQKKGIVESGVKYLKNNFLALRTFRDLAELNARARDWVVHEAGARVHGTTRAVGPACAQLIEHLLSDRILERLRAAQGVLRLSAQFNSARLEAACARALAHGSPFYRTVKTILAGGHDLRTDPSVSIEPASGYG